MKETEAEYRSRLNNELGRGKKEIVAMMSALEAFFNVDLEIAGSNSGGKIELWTHEKGTKKDESSMWHSFDIPYPDVESSAIAYTKEKHKHIAALCALKLTGFVPPLPLDVSRRRMGEESDEHVGWMMCLAGVVGIIVGGVLSMLFFL